MVVFDDITRLIAAQRTAAWAEVARRLAHEIRTPFPPSSSPPSGCTFGKLADRLDDEAARCSSARPRPSSNQVEAMKNLVNAFRDYARLPSPQMTPSTSTPWCARCWASTRARR